MGFLCIEIFDPLPRYLLISVLFCLSWSFIMFYLSVPVWVLPSLSILYLHNVPSYVLRLLCPFISSSPPPFVNYDQPCSISLSLLVLLSTLRFSICFTLLYLPSPLGRHKCTQKCGHDINGMFTSSPLYDGTNTLFEKTHKLLLK